MVTRNACPGGSPVLASSYALRRPRDVLTARGACRDPERLGNGTVASACALCGGGGDSAAGRLRGWKQRADAAVPLSDRRGGLPGGFDHVEPGHQERLRRGRAPRVEPG